MLVKWPGSAGRAAQRGNRPRNEVSAEFRRRREADPTGSSSGGSCKSTTTAIFSTSPKSIADCVAEMVLGELILGLKRFIENAQANRFRMAKKSVNTRRLAPLSSAWWARPLWVVTSVSVSRQLMIHWSFSKAEFRNWPSPATGLTVSHDSAPIRLLVRGSGIREDFDEASRIQLYRATVSIESCCPCREERRDV